MMAPRKRATTFPDPPLLFISYAHVDDEHRKRLCIHLTPLIRGKTLRVFDDTKLSREEGWRAQLIQKLNEADLVLLLVSADFLASDFCIEEEWPLVRMRWEARKAIVTFALVGPCQWKEMDIGQLQGVPVHGKLLPGEKREAEYFWDGIITKLREDARRIIGTRSAQSPTVMKLE